MASNIVPVKYQRLVSIIYYSVASLVGLALVVLVLLGILHVSGVLSLWAGFTLKNLLILLGVGIAFMATLFWFGMMLEVFKPNPQFTKLVNRSLIGAILAAVGAAVVSVLK